MRCARPGSVRVDGTQRWTAPLRDELSCKPVTLRQHGCSYCKPVPAQRAGTPRICRTSTPLRATRESRAAASPDQPKLAYPGVPGAFSEEAAVKALPDWEALPCEGFETVFQALTEYVVDRSIVPIENSLAGSLHSVYDLMLRYRVHIVGEVSIQVRHNLVALPGLAKAEVKRVVSHPQALMQCDSYLRSLHVVREEAFDTAAAAKSLTTRKSKATAAISSVRAAEQYGLEVLEHDVQDLYENITRFWILARDPLLMGEMDETNTIKTSIVFSLDEGPGQLFKALSVFSLRDIDITKIESRPMRSNPLIETSDGSDSGRQYNYLFYIDFLGCLSDEEIQNALRHLKEISPFLRVLGSYPMLHEDQLDPPISGTGQ